MARCQNRRLPRMSLVRRRGSTRRRQRSIRPKPSQAVRSTLGHLLASGVRNVISILPAASVLGPLADVVFKSIGLTSSISDTLYNAETMIYATLCCFTLSIVNFMSGVEGTVTDIDSAAKTILSPFRTGRLIELVLTVKPSGVNANRAGQLLVGVQPLVTLNDLATWTNMARNAWPQERGMKQMYLSTTGAATAPVTVRFVSKPFHGRCYVPTLVTDPLVAVVVRYENYSRTAYTDFSPSDFEFSVVAKGKIELFGEYPGADGASTGTGVSYTDAVVDLLEGAGMQVHDKMSHLTLGKDNFSCDPKDDGTCCLVSGTKLVTTPADLHSRMCCLVI